VCVCVCVCVSVLDGFPSPHELVVVREAAEARRHRADGRREKAVFQGARRDLLDPVGNRVKVLIGIQLRAERVLMGEGAAEASHPSPGAAEVVRVVVHAGAYRLQIGHFGPVWLAAAPPAPLQRIVLDVDDHAVPVARQRGALLGVPPLVLAVHRQEPEHHQVEEGPDDRQAHQDVHEAKGHVQGLLLEGAVLLKGHKVPEAYRS